MYPDQPRQVAQPDFSTLYRYSGLAALAAALLFRRNLDAEYRLFRSAGIIRNGPTTAPQEMSVWFDLLLERPLLGLTFLNLFDVVNILLAGLLFLALCVALRRASPSLALVSGALTLCSVSAYLVSNQAFNLLALSRRYAAADANAKQALLQSGRSLLALHQSNSFTAAGIHPGFLLISLAGLLLAFAMLRSPIFGRGCALTGLLANLSGLSYYLFRIAAPDLVFIPMSVSAVFLLAWYIMSGLRLLKLKS